MCSASAVDCCLFWGGAFSRCHSIILVSLSCIFNDCVFLRPFAKSKIGTHFFITVAQNPGAVWRRTWRSHPFSFSQRATSAPVKLWNELRFLSDRHYHHRFFCKVQSESWTAFLPPPFCHHDGLCWQRELNFIIDPLFLSAKVIGWSHVNNGAAGGASLWTRPPTTAQTWNRSLCLCFLAGVCIAFPPSSSIQNYLRFRIQKKMSGPLIYLFIEYAHARAYPNFFRCHPISFDFSNCGGPIYFAWFCFAALFPQFSRLETNMYSEYTSVRFPNSFVASSPIANCYMSSRVYRAKGDLRCWPFPWLPLINSPQVFMFSQW